MTSFEQFLIDKGCIKFVLNLRTKKYEVATNHTLSTLVNLDHRYIHHSDEDLLMKIAAGKSYMDEDFTMEQRKNEIIFGLNERDKPATLIYPRPKMQTGDIPTTCLGDDCMNAALQQFSPEEIFQAMYDRSIVLQVKTK